MGGAPAPWGRQREGALGGLGIGADGEEIRVGSWEGDAGRGTYRKGGEPILPFPVPKVSSPGFPPGTSQGSQARVRVPWDSPILGTLWKVQGLRPLGQSQEPRPSRDEVRSRGSDGRTGCGGCVNGMPGVGATTSLTSMPQDQTLLRQVTVQGNPGRQGQGAPAEHRPRLSLTVPTEMGGVASQGRASCGRRCFLPYSYAGNRLLHQQRHCNSMLRPRFRCFFSSSDTACSRERNRSAGSACSSSGEPSSLAASCRKCASSSAKKARSFL